MIVVKDGYIVDINIALKSTMLMNGPLIVGTSG